MNDAGMSIRDLAAELGLNSLTVEKAFRMFTIHQVAATDSVSLAEVLGCTATSAYSIVAYAKIKTGAPEAILPTPTAFVSVASLYALMGRAVVAWSRANLTGRHSVKVGHSCHVWIEVVGIELQMTHERPFGLTVKMLIDQPSSLYRFLEEVGLSYWLLSADEVLLSVVSYAQRMGGGD